GKGKASPITGDDGGYSIGGLLAGDYKVQFSASDTAYATEWYNSTVEAYTEAAAELVSAPGTDVDGELGLGGSISGMVTIDRQRIAGALINVYAAGNGPPDSPIGIATTGADGKYTVSGLPLGAHKMQFFEEIGTGSGAGLDEWYSDQVSFGDAALVSTGSYAVNVVLGGVNNYPVNLVPIYKVLLLD
ncbi:MAG: carboxypeptidase regulatory-like domain-containing protein, partial [Candidatus Electrothrix sp. AR4]|nr:carboxypeptidase regulatory-like domain-containing protein [Candidatus Electrothrix sp. AR4]